jgi:putative flippase GtrA
MKSLLSKQLVRFILVGLASNAVAFVTYLIMAELVRPIVAMSVLYGIGFVISFIGNKSFTFNSSANVVKTAMRFTLMHSVLFSLQYIIHNYFVLSLGMPHQVVQVGSVVIMGVLSYVISRKLVFITTVV